LLFNSGFNAIADFFTCMSQSGDALLHNEAIHTSVHGVAHASCVALRKPSCTMECVRCTLRSGLSGTGGGRSVLVSVESVYGMDGTVAPLRAMLSAMNEVFSTGEAHLVNFGRRRYPCNGVIWAWRPSMRHSEGHPASDPSTP
ncbi:hypothetical protein DFH94DRAFT_622298, partial [Russula ochroleuca]